MINLKLKYSFVILTYIILIFSIVLSYIAIVPEDDVPILRNNNEIFKVIENKFVEDENSVYEILEKKNKKTDIEDIIEKEIGLKAEKKVKGQFRLQFASFKDKEKSKKIAKNIKNEFFNQNKENLVIKKITLKTNETFYRVISNKIYDYKNAEKICELVKKKFQCIIIKAIE